MQEDTLIHTHRHFYPYLSNPPSSSQSRHPALWSLAGSPTHSLSPQPSMAPYCLERKSRLPTLTSGALPDLTRHGLAQAPWSRVGGLWFCFCFVHRTDSTHQSWDSVPYSVDSYYHPDITPHNPVPGPLKKKINKWVLISLKRIHPI